MAMTTTRDEREPMMELNTTPLIDVMLVLLVMFIITLPMQTHAVKVELPGPGQPPLAALNPLKNRIAIDAVGTVRWNGVAVDATTLRRYLDASVKLIPEPELQFQPNRTARYEVVDRTLAIIKRSKVTRLGFVGNERFSKDF